MPSYDCQAIDREEMMVRLTISAENRVRACQMLEARGLTPIKVLDFSAKSASRRERPRRPLRPVEIETFAGELSALLDANLGLDDALAFVADDAPMVAISDAASDLRADIRGGKAFSNALADHPGAFPDLFIGLAAAGEASSRLAEAMAEISGQMAERRKLLEDVRGKLAYPAFLLTGSVASIVLLATVVFPAFSDIFAETGVETPALTEAVLAVGDAITDWRLHAALAFGLVLLLVLYSASTERGKAGLYRRLYAAPLVGVIARDLAGAQFARVLGGLLNGGIRLVDALPIVAGTINDPLLRAAIERSRLAVRNGERLTDALRGESILPARLIQMLRVGETGGKLETMTLRAGVFHAGQARRRINRLVGLVTPATTLIMGLIIALMVGALMTALLNLAVVAP